MLDLRPNWPILLTINEIGVPPKLFKASLLAFLLVVSFCLSGWSQNGAPPIAGARGAALGQTGLTFTDAYSIFSNQAGLAYLKSFSGVVQAERRFMLSEIQSLSAGAALPTGSGTFGLSLNYYGFEDFNEQRIGLAYARKLFPKMSIGAQFLYLNTRIPEYGSTANFTFEVGLLMEIVPQLWAGFHVFSPIRVETVPNEHLPTILGLGLTYKPSEKVNINAEVQKDIEFKLRVKVGIEYQAADPFFLRIGAGTEPTLVSFGVGYHIQDNIAIDLASSYHQVLGFTPSIGVAYGGE